MSYSTVEIWGIILALGAGTFLIRLSFLGLPGGCAGRRWRCGCYATRPSR